MDSLLPSLLHDLNPKVPEGVFLEPRPTGFKGGGPGGGGRRSAPKETPEADALEIPLQPLQEPEKKTKVVLRNPKFDSKETRFNEETDVSVEVQLPPEHEGKKKVLFELFAKTPKGPERISQVEGFEDGGRAVGKIPVYRP